MTQRQTGERRWGRHAAAIIILLSAPALLPGASRAQETNDGGAVTPDSADAIRASLVQPPGKPPFDAADAVGLPFRIAFFPIRVLGEGGARLIGFTTNLLRPRETSIFDMLAEAGFHPRFSSIGPRSRAAIGLRYDRWSPFYAESFLSIRGSQHHAVGLAFDAPDHLIDVSYIFHRDAEPHFWGVGPDSRRRDESDFRLDRQSVTASASFHRFPFTFGGGVAYEDNRVARGFDGEEADLQDVFGDLSLFGVAERNRFVVLSLGGAIDGTHVAELQRRGLDFQVRSSVFLGADGTDSDFHRIEGAVNGYLPLNLRQSLAVRGIAEINRGGGGRGVPFTHLAALGGDHGARAYKTLRFRDRDLIAIMSEWRYEVWRELHERGRAESFLLFDVGTVEHSLTEVDVGDLRLSYGFGMRLNWGGNARWLAYIAFGEEGARFDTAFSYVY